MLQSSFTITIGPEDLHNQGITIVTQDYLDEVASRMEDVYQECMFRYQLEDAIEAIESEKEF